MTSKYVQYYQQQRTKKVLSIVAGYSVFMAIAGLLIAGTVIQVSGIGQLDRETARGGTTNTSCRCQ